MQVGLSSGSDAGWVEFPQDGEHWSKICVTLGKVSQVPAKAAALVADCLFVGAANQIAVLLTKTRGLYRDERPPGEVTSVEPSTRYDLKVIATMSFRHFNRQVGIKERLAGAVSLRIRDAERVRGRRQRDAFDGCGGHGARVVGGRGGV